MKSLMILGAAVIAAASLSPALAADEGELAFSYCYSCHSVDPKETGLPGPNLFGVVGRPIAAQPGFKYSKAMQAFAAKSDNKVWTLRLLDKFLAKPQGLVPGTLMEPPPQTARPAIRKAVIAYLKKHG